MTHPFDFLPLTSRKPLFIALLLLTLCLFAVFQLLNTPLTTPDAPAGIVTFELAGSPEKSAAILASWDETARLFAAFGLGLDYLFMPCYALALSLGTLLATDRLGGRPKALGALAGWGALAAALFDAVENFALWHILLGAWTTTPWPEVASVCAQFKFGLLLLGLLYALTGWLWPQKRG
ncbi:MAG: hypothetical protein Fur0043_04900 [Anaerolineales bacterium]